MIEMGSFDEREETDSGFIIRANSDVAGYLKEFISGKTDKTVLDLIPLDITK
jgi:hypothetical protein